ncbi:MAG: ribokinase [Terrimicrobiaceae bacterium]
MGHTPRILLFGSSNTDLVIVCDRLPAPGETLLGGKFQRTAGGKGANQAVAAARAGARVVFVGARGEDDFGAVAAAGLRREKIDLRHFKAHKDVSSGIALILLGGKSRENLIAVARSANDLVSGETVRSVRSEFAKSDVVVTQLEIPLPAVKEAARLASEQQIPFLLNPAPARALPKSLLRLVHTLTPNEHEAAILTGESNPERAGEKLLKAGCRNVVITLGAKGALLVDGSGAHRFPAPKVKPVDTVGAGDCFTGWLATGIAESLTMGQAVERAVRAAGIAITRAGAQDAMPRREEVC